MNKVSKIEKRFILAPMTRCISKINGCPSKQLGKFYVDQVKNGLTTIITESCAVNGEDARGYLNGSQFFNDQHAKSWAPIINQVHKHGGKIFIQLFHSGRLTVKKITNCNPISASALEPSEVPSFWRPLFDQKIVHFQTMTKFEKPKKVSLGKIRKIINQFRRSSELAKNVGFDGVEIHGAHGYLVHSFSTFDANQRKDIYNSKSNLFSSELIEECKSVLGKTLLSYRISLHTVDNPYAKYSKDIYNIPSLIKALDKAGVDIFHCSEVKAGENMFGSNESLLELVRKNTKKKIITCGGIDTLEKIKRLDKKGADYFAFGRSALSNRDLVKKIISKKRLIKFEYEKHFYETRN